MSLINLKKYLFANKKLGNKGILVIIALKAIIFSSSNKLLKEGNRISSLLAVFKAEFHF
jgi:hypothetical protein